jgi:hypothetical protein
MQDDPLYQYAKQFIDEKGDQPIELQEKMLNEILASMNEFVNAEFISRLTLSGIDDFNTLLDKNASDEQIQQFFEDSGVDIANATATALIKFKQAYIGA